MATTSTDKKLGPVEQYDAACAANKFVFVVFYRGSWCPFCMGYLRTLQSISSSIAAAGGHVLAITSEEAAKLQKTRDASGHTGDTIVDPENLLAKELKRRGVIDVAISEKGGYPHGMAQPAVLVASTDNVLYKWAIVPSLMNIGGAKDRPLLNEIWDNVEAQMHGRPEKHQKIGKIGVMFGMKQAILGH